MDGSELPRPDGPISPEAFFAGEMDDKDGAVEIEVLDDNWNIVQVFRTCQPGFITGMHAPVYAGISAVEIQAACALLRISPEDDLVAGIKVMSEETARVYSNG